jgi:hypothetical protein
MSLTGALLAVFIQQWARSYLQATQGRHSPRHRARIRTYHAEGLDKWHLHQVTRTVPVLIHVSLFLFFSGLPVFLFYVNRTVFNVVVTWLALCVAGYACITLMPIFCQDSPYSSPLSSSIWFWLVNVLFIIYRLLKIFISRDSSIFQWYHAHYAKSHLRWPSLRAMQKAAAHFSLQLSSDIDYRALLWMFRTLSDDDEFESFFDALPSLCDSEALGDSQRAFIKPNEKILSHALVGMMDRTLLSDLVPEEVKQRRIIICTKAIDATSLLGPWWTLRRVLFGDWHGFSRSVHFGLFVQGWKSISNPVTAFYAQYVVAVTLASAQVRDDNWFQLASGQLNESKSLLWGYYAYGDSILLANAIFIIRRTIQTHSGSEGHHRIDIAEASRKTLELVCRFDVQNTLPEHQHQFCSLWNQLVDAAQNNTHPHVTSLCKMVLKYIRRLYITLHEDTPFSPTAFSFSTDDEDRVLDDAESFPRCEMYEHEHSHPVPELQLGELPRNARTNLANSIDMIPRMSPTLIPAALPTFTPHQSASRSRRTSVVSGSFADIPTPYDGRWSPSRGRSHSFGGSSYYPHASGPYYPPTPAPYHAPTLGPHYPVSSGPHYPVIPGPYSGHPVVPGPYSYSPPPAPPGVSPFVPIPQMTSGRTQRRRRRRRRRGLPATVAETDSQQDSNVPRSPSASSYRSSSPASHVQRVPEPAPAWERPDVNSPGINIPISTRAPRTTASHFDASHDMSGPPAADRSERPSSPPAMIIPETLPAASLPTPASAAGSGTATPVQPVNLSSPQELISTPPSPPSVPQEPPVTHQGTSIPVKASKDTGPTRHVVTFDIPSPSTPSATPVPLSSHGMSAATAATAASSSRAVPVHTHMTRGGTRSSSVGRGSHARSTPLATPPVIKFNGHGEFSGLLYYSLHSVVYDDELYPTALHLFEARKFLPHRPDLADRIRQCERVEEVASVSATLAEFVRRDWYIVALSTVSNCFPSCTPSGEYFFFTDRLLVDAWSDA